MPTRVIKYQSFGSPLQERNKEYTCLKEWPSDISLQCGDKGVVLKKNGGYRTAFFEVFGKEDFVRGEGETLEIAESNAFDKLMKIKNCVEHKYEREKDSIDAECILCKHKEKKYFPPVSKCQQCGMDHAQLKIKNENLCISHYISVAEKMDLSINEEKIINIKKEVFNEIKEEKEEDKNIISLMISSKDDKIVSYEDIQDDDFRVEMKIGELEDINQNLKLIKSLVELGLDKKYPEEYLFIYEIEDLKDVNYMTCCSKAIDTIKKTISLMVEKEIIKGDPSVIDYKYTQKNPKIIDDIIEFFKNYMVALKIEKKHNLDHEKLIKMIVGISTEEKQNELMNELSKDVISFYNENKKKINFKKISFN